MYTSRLSHTVTLASVFVSSTFKTGSSESDGLDYPTLADVCKFPEGSTSSQASIDWNNLEIRDGSLLSSCIDPQSSRPSLRLSSLVDGEPPKRQYINTNEAHSNQLDQHIPMPSIACKDQNRHPLGVHESGMVEIYEDLRCCAANEIQCAKCCVETMGVQWEWISPQYNNPGNIERSSSLCRC